MIDSKIIIKKTKTLKDLLSIVLKYQTINQLFIEKYDKKYFENKITLESLRKYSIDLSEVIEHIKEIIATETNNLDGDNFNRFNTFIAEEMAKINWIIFNEVTVVNELFSDLVKLNDETINITEEDRIKKFVNSFSELIQELLNRSQSIVLFSKVYSIDTNLVIIGPNGSGKSHFSRNLKGVLKDELTIISAQRILYFDAPKTINVGDNYLEILKKFHAKTKLTKDQDFLKDTLEDFTLLLMTLFEEKREKAFNSFLKETNGFDDKEIKESLIDKTIDIWGKIFTDKRLIHNKVYSLIVESDENIKYSFNELSDGERAVFYYIAHTLLTENKHYILIDEPENHLHLSLCIKVWDLLEIERSDCKFIYITHNLDFATSRRNKKIIWNKKYKPPFNWDFETIDHIEEISEKQILEMLGAKKNILFCEGERSSFDYKIYSELFSDFYVIPVGGHDDVINSVKASNHHKLLKSYKVKGIIDGDYWTEGHLKKYEENNIFVLPFNEIENLIGAKNVIEKIFIRMGIKEQFKNFEEKLFKIAEGTKEKAALEYTRQSVNNIFKWEALESNKSIETLIEEISLRTSEERIKKLYKDRIELFDGLIVMKNYEKLFSIFPIKEKLIGLCKSDISKNFEDAFINMLKLEDREIRIEIEKNIADLISKINN